MYTQARLLNSLVRLAGRVNNPRTLCNFHNSVQYTKSKHFLKRLTFFLFPEHVHVASSTTLYTQAAQSLPETQNLSKLHYLLLLLSKSCHLACTSKFNPIKIVSAVTCTSLSMKFAVLRREWKRDPRQTLPRPATVTGITEKVLIYRRFLVILRRGLRNDTPEFKALRADCIKQFSVCSEECLISLMKHCKLVSAFCLTLNYL